MFQSGRKNAAPGVKQPGLSFIGSDLLVSGDVSTGGQVHVDGRVDGNVRCQILIQGESGTIAGNIIAEEARIAGLVDGAVAARVVTLDATAKVTGDVTYQILSIAAGAVIDGRLARKEALGDAPLATIEIAAAEPARPPAGELPLPALGKPAAVAA